MCSGLRFRQVEGGPKVEVLRPQNTSRSQYLDSDDEPTLVTFEDGALVDIPSLLATGAIVPWEPVAAVLPVTGGYGSVTDAWRPHKDPDDG